MQTNEPLKVGPALDDRDVFHVLTSLGLRAVSLVLRSLLAVVGRATGEKLVSARENGPKRDHR